MYQTIADALKDAECDAGVRAILFTVNRKYSRQAMTSMISEESASEH